MRVQAKLREDVFYVLQEARQRCTHEPLDHDDDLDIATFAIESLISECGQREFYPLAHDRARRSALKKGDILFVLGYPGNLRQPSEKELRIGGQPYVIGVSDVSQRRFVSNVSRLHLNAKDFGGVSGGPCFLVKPNYSIRLAGITTDYAIDVLRFTKACCIHPDGTINREP